MTKQLFDKQYSFVLKNMKKEIENYDQEWFENYNRHEYKVIGFRTRLIITEFGDLIIRRREYKNLDKNSNIHYYIPVDDKFGFDKRSRIHPQLKQKIIQEAGSGKRYRDIRDQFPKANLSLMTISRIFNSCDYLKKMNVVNEKVKLKDKQIVYIYMDDTFTKVYDKKLGKIREQKFRVVSFNLGFVDPKAKRKKLKDKRSFFIYDKKINKAELIANEVRKWGHKFYEGFGEAKIVVGGDGATWIKNVAQELNGKYVLDNFHAKKKLLEGFKINARHPKQDIRKYNLFRIAYSYFNNGMYKEFLIIVKEHLSKETYKYFRNNESGITAWANPWCIGVSAESEVSRLVKSVLGYGSKLFNSVTLLNLVGARAYKINNYGSF